MKSFLLVPEAPIVESWKWQTDTIVSDNGTEQRIATMDLPTRGLNLKYTFDTSDEMNAVVMSLMNTGDGLEVPFYQAATRLKASIAAGANALAFNPARTDLRPGGRAVLFDRFGRTEIVTIALVTAGGATLAAPTAMGWNARANIAPVWAMFPTGQLSLNRNNPDNKASLSAAFSELGFMDDFANPFAPYVFPMFNGYPVLNTNSIGSEFEQAYDTGATSKTYGGVTELRNPWLHAQIVMPRNFLCQRVLEPESWNKWRALAAYAKGSANPFYLPTFRQDFPVVVMPGGNAANVVFKGTLYAEEFAPFEPFRQFAFFFENGGVHFAKVSNCAIVGGNTVVTFAPAIPAGMTPAKKVSMLLKVRIADDAISCEHEGLHTTVSMNLRTVDD